MFTHKFPFFLKLLTFWYVGDVQFFEVTNQSARVMWTIPYVSLQQEYRVLYGYTEDTINITAGVIQGNPDTSLENQTYTLDISGLEQATTYYVQVVSTFTFYTLYSDIAVFTTRESGKQSITQ